jgi:phosphohistidine swiveling domain-containing protein
VQYCFKLNKTVRKARLIGNKAYNLSLTAKYAKIPNGIVVTTDAYSEFINNKAISDELLNCVENFVKSKITEDTYNKRTLELLEKLVINDQISLEIEDSIKDLQPPFVVRSSATCEDLPNVSFAGRFDTLLNLDRKDVKNAIKKVFFSLFSPRAVKYMAENKIEIKNVKMACIVQEMVLNSKYGVGFFFNSDENNSKRYVIEAVSNNPEGVTAGTKTPDTYIINKETREIIRYKAESEKSVLFDFEIKDLSSIMEKIGHIMFPLDIEWAYSANGPILLQARKLTAKVPLRSSNMEFGGFPASSGSVCGKAVIFDPKANIDEMIKGMDRLLVAGELPLDDSYIIKEFGGVILEPAGITSHVAILSREYKVPCVVGVEKASTIIKNNEEVCIDGDTGKVTLPNRKELVIKKVRKATYVDTDKLSIFKYRNKIAIIEKDYNNITLHYHQSLGDNLNIIIAALHKKYNLPILDGGSEVWYRYSVLFEVCKRSKRIRKEVLEAAKITRTKDIEKIDKKVNYYLKIASSYYDDSKHLLNQYVIEDKNTLSKALKLSLYSFGYWTIPSNVMLRDCIEDIFADDKNKSQTLVNYIDKIVIEKNHPVHGMGGEIVELMDSIYNIAKRDYGLVYEKATSELSFATKIKKIKQNQY